MAPRARFTFLITICKFVHPPSLSYWFLLILPKFSPLSAVLDAKCVTVLLVGEEVEAAVRKEEQDFEYYFLNYFFSNLLWVVLKR